MRAQSPFNLLDWIGSHRDLLKPPWATSCCSRTARSSSWPSAAPTHARIFITIPTPSCSCRSRATSCSGPCRRAGCSTSPSGRGEIFLLPAEIPHSPQRPAGTVGIVVERRRAADELDGFSWYCEHCGHQLYIERVAVRNIETQLPEIFARFYADVARRTCAVCGTVMQPPAR